MYGAADYRRAISTPEGVGLVMDAVDAMSGEDGIFRDISYDNALPWDGEQVLPWAVEAVDTDTGERSVREYREDRMDAEIAAQTMWDDLDPQDRLHTEVRYGEVRSCSDDLRDYESIAIEWRYWADIPWREVQEYLDPFFANDRPRDLVAEAGGDIDRAAREWVDWWFGDGEDACVDAADQRVELAETLGLKPEELTPLVAQYMAEDRDTVLTCTKTVAANGNGLMISITKEARILGLGRGDAVEITIRRI